MPKIPVVMPQLGESIAEAMVVAFNVEQGAAVKADQEVVEVETNKAVMNVTAPCEGEIVEWTVEINQTYPVGATLGYLEVSEEDARQHGPKKPSEDVGAAQDLPDAGGFAEKSGQRPEPETRGVQPTVRGLPVPANLSSGISYLSPRMKARMLELGLHSGDLAGVAGSGAGGRVTVKDFEKFISDIEDNRTSPASPMRVAVADAMRRSWTRPLATVGMRVALDKLLAHRKSCSPKPGVALYTIRSLAIALAEDSAPAGRLVGEKIVHPQSFDVGFAVEVKDGVLVPVIRHADQKSLKEMVEIYDSLVEQARKRKLSPELTGGSVATVTNFGSFGLVWATPIPLPEQTLVLGIGVGRVVPQWNAETKTFEPVTEAELTLSFDHRVLDGGGAGRLLSRISALLNAPETL